MPHPLVLQLRFTRSEFQSGLAGVSDDDARRRWDPWRTIIRAADLLQPRTFVIAGTTIQLTFGTFMQRVIYH